LLDYISVRAGLKHVLAQSKYHLGGGAVLTRSNKLSIHINLALKKSNILYNIWKTSRFPVATTRERRGPIQPNLILIALNPPTPPTHNTRALYFTWSHADVFWGFILFNKPGKLKVRRMFVSVTSFKSPEDNNVNKFESEGFPKWSLLRTSQVSSAIYWYAWSTFKPQELPVTWI